MPSLAPPYGVIKDKLYDGKVVPFLGAGASMRAACRVWELCLNNPLAATPPCYLPDKCEGFTPPKPKGGCLPKTNELACYLARQANFPSGESIDLAKAAQYYGAATGLNALYDELHEIFDHDYPFNKVHQLLADVQANRLIVTTNYDDLIERAFDAVDRPYDMVIHTTTPEMGDYLLWVPHGASTPEKVVPNKLDINLEETTVIYKMHGTVARQSREYDQFVISEDDYINFLSRMVDSKVLPAMFAEPFLSLPFLFLGYSLRDWNLRVVLNHIDKSLRPLDKGRRSWAIQSPISELEKLFWDKKNINVYERTVEHFVEELLGS